jgi:hypothetical protein
VKYRSQITLAYDSLVILNRNFVFRIILMSMRAGIAQSVLQLAAGSTAERSDFGSWWKQNVQVTKSFRPVLGPSQLVT